MHRIALYGLSIETEKAIKKLADDNEIIGLLDSYQNSGEMYGYPIISIDETVERAVEEIIVVARPGSCRAIAGKIGGCCREKGIRLTDIRGKNLLEKNEVSFSFGEGDLIDYDNFFDELKAADVVSFDLFDTLVVRKTLQSAGIVDIVGCRACGETDKISEFVNRRLQAEKRLSQGKSPFLADIYADFTDQIHAETYAGLEYETDYSAIIPRRDMVNLANRLSSEGKRVAIITDTYYTEDEIRRILDKVGIDKSIEVYPSSKYGVGKRDGLFETVKHITGYQEKSKDEEQPGALWVHIGDDQVSDYESAVNAGLRAVKIPSAFDLFEKLGYMGLDNLESSLSDRIKLGMVISRIFNSPFKGTGDKVTISESEDLGYCLAAPVITDFILWMKEKINKDGFEQILFSARDGFLIKKLYDFLIGNEESVYYATSRTAAIRAGINSREELEYVANMKFSGTVSKQLEKRFGITGTEYRGESLMDYEKEIMLKSAALKENNLKYIDSLNLRNGKTAFFDFVAKGTIQLFAGKILDCELTGLYFLQLERTNMASYGLNIESFLESDDVRHSTIFDDYYILEPVVTAPHPSVIEFSDDGEPVYDTEIRSAEDLECVGKLQSGITEFFTDYISLCPESKRTVNTPMDEKLLGMIHKISLETEDFLNITVEDPFFNRMTSMKTLI